MPANVYLRGSTWWGRTTIRGAEYRESLRLRSPRTSRNAAIKAAEAWVERLHAELRGDAGVQTFDTIAERFVLERLPELKPRTAERYRVSLRALVPFFEGKELDEVRRADLRKFENARKSQGASPSTIIHDLQVLSAAIGFFCDLEDLEFSNPVPRYLRARRRDKALVAGAPGDRYLTVTEEVTLLQTIRRRREKDDRLAGLAEAVEFAIDTGLRLEEQFSLRWQDVDMVKKRVHVRAEVAKSRRGRWVPLLPRSAQILAHLPRRLRAADDQDWVFVNRHGDRYANRTKAFNNAVKASGLNRLVWKDLRRTCGCRRLQDMEWSMEKVQLLLGHESLTTTERHYAFLEVDHLESPSAQKTAQDRRSDSGDLA